jgi:hypothetical protein
MITLIAEELNLRWSQVKSTSSCWTPTTRCRSSRDNRKEMTGSLDEEIDSRDR